MSYYDDWIEDGTACSCCCQYIGTPVGYTRRCKDCEDDNAIQTVASSKRKSKNKRLLQKASIPIDGKSEA